MRPIVVARCIRVKVGTAKSRPRVDPALLIATVPCFLDLGTTSGPALLYAGARGREVVGQDQAYPVRRVALSNPVTAVRRRPSRVVLPTVDSGRSAGGGFKRSSQQLCALISAARQRRR